MPTILQINTYDGGSTGSIARNINAIAEQNGWVAYLYYGRDSYHTSNTNNAKIIGRGLFYKMRILFHVLITRVFDKHGCGSYQDTKHLIAEIERIKPDIIHLHNIHGYYLNYKLLFKYLQEADIPVVWTLHDCWSMTGHCAHFVSADCQKWQTQCHDCPLLKAYPRTKRDNSCSNHKIKRKVFTSLGDKLHLISVSKWLNSVVNKSFFVSSGAHQHVIYNGIDGSLFTPQAATSKSQLGLPDKKILLGLATSWSQSKGLSDFLQLADMLPKEYQIVLVGIPRKQIEVLPKSVIARPRTDSVEELVQYYSVADVVLNLSRAETFGLTTVEGLACGTPSVVYNTTASPELITPQTGRIVEQGDLEGVVKAVEELCAEDRVELRKHCREYALEHFDRNKNYEKYINLYEHLLQK